MIPRAFAVLIVLFGGCSRSTKAPEDLRALSSGYEEAYYESPAEEAKAALWNLIRTDERALRENGMNPPKPGMDIYGIAMSYTRLAMIAEAEGQSEAAEAFFSMAIRYWSEVANLGKDKRMKINKRMAVWTIDSIEHERSPRWRKDLARPPSIYHPKFQVNAEGDIVEK